MLMRFHWGLAVGHTYTHQQPSTNAGFIWADTDQSTRSRDIFTGGELLDQIEDLDNPTCTERDSGFDSHTDGSGDSDTDDDDYDPADEDDHSSSDEDDLECLGLDEMYGEGGLDDEY
jgi:hypothetical protein